LGFPGYTADKQTHPKAAELTSKETNPPSDLRGSHDFRKQMVKVYVTDASVVHDKC
jgi:CO/xanthine dehydrogenase FAD-binding subunit